jgi:hypothetical protein
MKKLYTACLSLVIFCSLFVGVVAADSQAQPTTLFNLPSYLQALSPTQFVLPSDLQAQSPTTTTKTTTTTTTTPTTEATILSGLPLSLQEMVNLI